MSNALEQLKHRLGGLPPEEKTYEVTIWRTSFRTVWVKAESEVFAVEEARDLIDDHATWDDCDPTFEVEETT
jgi:hypothetical protein